MVKIARSVELERNDKQIEFFNTAINNRADFLKGNNKDGWERGFTACAQFARGTGKTFLEMDLLGHSAKELPGACLALGGRTYTQVQSIILQQMAFVFKQHGLTEFDAKYNKRGNYVVFTKPPAHWRKPHFPTRDYSRAVSFANGAYIQLVSADRPDTLRGGNWDQRHLDESGSCSEDFIATTDPNTRANKYKYTNRNHPNLNHPLHWARFDYTSQPRTPKGQWIYKTQENAIKDPAGYYFLQGSAQDNLKFLPGSYIEDMKAKMNDLDFRIEILNERITRLSNAFYPALDASVHTYVDNKYKYDEESGIYKEADNRINSFKELIVGFDFNSYFTSLLVAQEGDKAFRFVDCMYVKQSNKPLVEQLIDDFIAAYQHHLKKTIRLRGDQSGKRKGENAYESSYDIIKRKLKAAGWIVVDEVQSSYPSYHDRYIILNSLLNNDNPRLPKIEIHELRCKSLLLALQLTPADGATFEKDKSSERSLIIPQEKATHLTDIFDYILCYSFAKYVITSGSRGSLDFR